MNYDQTIALSDVCKWLVQWFLTWGKFTARGKPRSKFHPPRGEIYWIVNYRKRTFLQILQNIISSIIRLVSHRTKYKSTSDTFLFVYLMRGFDVRRHRALLRSRYTDISHKLEMLHPVVGLRLGGPEARLKTGAPLMMSSFLANRDKHFDQA